MLEEVEEPKKREGTVKLDIKYCGICGSDIGIYLGTHPRAKAPLVFGHEFLGIVAEDGQKFKKGDRVVPFPLLSCGQCRACRTGNEHAIPWDWSALIRMAACANGSMWMKTCCTRFQTG